MPLTPAEFLTGLPPLDFVGAARLHCEEAGISIDELALRANMFPQDIEALNTQPYDPATVWKLDDALGQVRGTLKRTAGYLTYGARQVTIEGVRERFASYP